MSAFLVQEAPARCGGLVLSRLLGHVDIAGRCNLRDRCPGFWSVVAFSPGLEHLRPNLIGCWWVVSLVPRPGYAP